LVGELLHVRERDLAGQDRVVARDVGLGVMRPVFELDSIPERNCSKPKRLQSIPISSPTRRASSIVIRLVSVIFSLLVALGLLFPKTGELRPRPVALRGSCYALACTSEARS
jgi:hypothetical protein